MSVDLKMLELSHYEQLHLYSELYQKKGHESIIDESVVRMGSLTETEQREAIVKKIKRVWDYCLFQTVLRCRRDHKSPEEIATFLKIRSHTSYNHWALQPTRGG